MRIKLLGCGVFEPELEALLPLTPHEVDFEPLDAGLHEVPNELRDRLQTAIDRAAEEGFDAVALAYGLCGRGTSGLIARGITVVIPRVHDCLTLFLGSREEYRRQFREHPGTYYITPGWFTRKMGMDQSGRPLLWTHEVRDHPSFAERDLSSVRGGNVTALLPQAQQLDADVPKATSLGMSETLGPHTFDDGSPLPPEKAGSFGPSVPGVEHKVVDPVTLEELPTGEVGELWLRGYPLMLGLHKRERAETFTPDGWYRTGDAGRFDEDGHFYFTGRMGDLIKTSGMNVTSREVEAVLEEQPEVSTAFVTGVDHPDRGQDVVAAIALRPGESLSADEVRRRLRAELSSYKVPRHVAVFASQAELPMLESGKLDRRRLTALLGERFGG